MSITSGLHRLRRSRAVFGLVSLLAAGGLVLAGSPALAQTVMIVDEFGATGTTFANGVAVNAIGDIYVVGTTTGDLGGDALIGTEDAYVAKYAAGADTPTWLIHLGVAGAVTTGLGVTVDSNGNVYVVGATDGDLGGAGTLIGFRDGYLARVDGANGNIRWVRHIGDLVSVATATSVSINSSSMVYVGGNISAGEQIPGAAHARRPARAPHSRLSGFTRSFMRPAQIMRPARSMRPGQVMRPHQPIGIQDGFVMRFSTGGALVWQRFIGATGAFVSVNGVAASVDGSVYAAGDTSGAAIPGGVLQGTQDGWGRKYSADAGLRWSDEWGVPTSTSTTATSAAVSPGGQDVYFGGGSTGSLQNTNTGAYVRAYTANNFFRWTRQFGATSTDAVNGVAVDSAGNVDTVGIVTSGGTLPGCTSPCAASGGNDAFARKFTRNGTVLWTRQGTNPVDATSLSTTADDSANGVATRGSNVLIAGTTFGTYPGQTLVGSPDGFLARIAP